MLEKQNEAEQALEETPETALSGNQQLYQRIVRLMKEQKPYTDSNMNRDSMAQLLGTNYNLLADAIRECANGQSIGDFIEDWRLRYAAQLLAETNHSIGLVMEMSGFVSIMSSCIRRVPSLDAFERSIELVTQHRQVCIQFLRCVFCINLCRDDVRVS